MAVETGKARHLARRDKVRGNIPLTIGIPKFLTPAEIKKICSIKGRNPVRGWQSIVDEVVEESRLFTG